MKGSGVRVPASALAKCLQSAGFPVQLEMSSGLKAGYGSDLEAGSGCAGTKKRSHPGQEWERLGPTARGLNGLLRGAVAVERDAECAGVLGGHAGAPHVAAAGVGDLADVNDASDCGVPVSEQERDLVDGLAGEQRP